MGWPHDYHSAMQVAQELCVQAMPAVERERRQDTLSQCTITSVRREVVPQELLGGMVQ